ncbi:hypothetical protein GCK72_007018 [Caenorhabditis remanei]|uniref:Uncharacterized protein n=1 Tax=Caenorhabditis remanei TaxID=31234 RepID=A0A6A5HGD6_CAERE|nr:hypothetical protein GCK72_007018 [Caenorhabditis remanei]KAF1767060.1 hypothetical protein GCK72_007018 [Caenorhabditis remanei]
MSTYSSPTSPSELPSLASSPEPGSQDTAGYQLQNYYIRKIQKLTEENQLLSNELTSSNQSLHVSREIGRVLIQANNDVYKQYEEQKKRADQLEKQLNALKKYHILRKIETESEKEMERNSKRKQSRRKRGRRTGKKETKGAKKY